MLEELYKQYGEKMIQFEILQNQITNLKKQIADELNKLNQAKQDQPGV